MLITLKLDPTLIGLNEKQIHEKTKKAKKIKEQKP